MRKHPARSRHGGLRRVLAILLVALGPLGSPIASALAAHDSEFVIGLHWDPGIGIDVAADSGECALAKDAYFNLFSGIRSYAKILAPGCSVPPGLPDCRIIPIREEMDYALLIAAKVGVKSLVTEWGFFDARFFADPARDPAYVWYLQNMLDHYGSLSNPQQDAIYGYYYKDEPDIGYATSLAKTVEWMKQHTDRPTYVNLLPAYAFDSPACGLPAQHTAYEAYLDSFLTRPSGAQDLEIVSYDHYPFHPSCEKIRKSYYYNLRVIRERARGRPIWAIAMSTQWSSYEPPTAEQIRFLALCPIAYGALGLSYYTYALPGTCFPGQHRNALLDKGGLPNPNYHTVKEINHWITSVLGPVVMRSTSVGAFHQSPSTPLGETIPATELVTSPGSALVARLSSDALLVGVFEDPVDPSRSHGLVVNQSLARVAGAHVTLAGDYRDRVQTAPRQVGYAGDTDWFPAEVAYSPALDQSVFGIGDLEGGEGALFVAGGSLPVTTPGAGPLDDLEVVARGPNPAANEVDFVFGLSSPGQVRIDILDPQGRRLRDLTNRVYGAGRQALTWDRRDDRGAPVPAGVYWYRAKIGGRSSRGKLVLLQ